ncbi:phosphotransferase [Nonomuraea sp. NPDC050790]|uniref:phosphotransferase n=1 Tax=Nonomuraea sp. NPDC050790 TaxID=3364371 RepID=UPI0037A7CEC0
MRSGEIRRVAAALGRTVVETSTLAGGFSHETCLLTLTDGQVVARFGGGDPAIEAAVMTAAGGQVPVPRVLTVLPSGPAAENGRPGMVLEYVAGTPLSRVLADGSITATSMGDLGAEVGRVVAGIGAVRFGHPGFFIDEHLSVGPERPWSQQLGEVAETCMAATAEARLDQATRRAWVSLCASHAPALARIDEQARLVHADINPKNILVTRTRGGWRVDAVLDWEFGYSGCPYGDAANMVRFGTGYPAGFVDGFCRAFAEHQPADLPLAEEWSYLGRVLDMFALSDLVTRPAGHPVAEQAAEQIRLWVGQGVPSAGPGRHAGSTTAPRPRRRSP